MWSLGQEWLDPAKVLTSRKIVFYNKEQVFSSLSKQSFPSKIDNLGAKVVLWGCTLTVLQLTQKVPC